MQLAQVDENFIDQQIRDKVFAGMALDDFREVLVETLRSDFQEVNSEIDYSSVLHMNVYADDHEIVFDTYDGKLYLLIDGREHHDLPVIDDVCSLAAAIINRIN